MSGSDKKAALNGRGEAARTSSAFGPGTYMTAAGAVEAEGDYRTAALRIPTLRAGVPAPRAFDGTTCFEGGYLVEKNAGWRQVRPVIAAGACTGCLSCYMYCPDGAIRKTHADSGAAVFVDYDFCKGCGICKSVCRFGAIEMRNEVEALEEEARANEAAAAAVAGGQDAGGQDAESAEPEEEGGAR